MPEPTAPGSEAADAVTTASTTDGVTPPNAEATADTQQDQKTTSKYEQAMAALNKIDVRADGPDEEIGELAEDDPLAGSPEAQAEEPEDEARETVPESDEDQQEETSEEEEPKAEADGRKRLNINRKKKGTDDFVYNERERAILHLSAEQGIPLAEAEEILFGKRQPVEKAPAEAAPESTKEPTVAEIDAQAKTLKEQRKNARTNFDDAKVDELTEQLEELQTQRQEALIRELQGQQARQNSEQEQVSALTQQVEASIERASKAYPDAAKEGTKLHAAIAADLETLRQAKSPLLELPDWPEVLTLRHALRLGEKATAPAPAPVAKPPAPKPAAPARKATPLPSPGGLSSPAPQTNRVESLRQQLRDAQSKNDWKKIEALGAEIHSLA